MNTRILSALAVSVLVMIFGTLGGEEIAHHLLLIGGSALFTAVIWIVLLVLVIWIEDGRK